MLYEVITNHPVTLVDSGGVKVEREGFDELVANKSLSLLAESDAIIFMMECTEVTAEDQELLGALRPYSDKVVLTVNKLDDPKRDDLLWEYYQYGFQRRITSYNVCYTKLLRED